MRGSKFPILGKVKFAAGFTALLCSISFGQAAEAKNTAASPHRPLKYGIVVDNSGSMRLQLENIIDLVKNLVDQNQPDDEVFLVRFVTSDKVVLVEELTSAKAVIQDAAEEMFIEGGQTAILDAISFSAKYLDEKTAADTSAAKVLVLITDGDDRDSSARIEQVAAQVKQSNIRVFAIGISDLKVEMKTLDKLTKGTGGKVFLPKGPVERQTAPKAVAVAIRGT